MIEALAKGLCQIANSLPRIEFAIILYPTLRMKQAVAELYAHIIRFLIRARDWYQESKPLHILHALTRPVELRYADIMKDVEGCTKSVHSLASAGAQAEQRDMHLELQEMARKQEASDAVLLEIRQIVISELKSRFQYVPTHRDT